MIETVENARLYMPAPDPEKPNERPVMHPETNAGQVIVDAAGTRLDDHLGPQIVVSSDKPNRNNVLWAKVTSTRVVT